MEQLIRDIQNIASEIGDNPSTGSAAADFARVLGWTQGLSDIKDVLIDDRLKLTRGYIGTQPAVVFAFGTEKESSVNEAALYAYHASIHWGLSFNKKGATLFNSHWLRSNEWFQLPFIAWSEFERNIDIFDALRPEKIKNNDIAKIATHFYQPDKILKPVDDALVERLDFWRAEALRFSSRVEGVDDDLQTLFAQLFVLRAVEDRDLAPDIPPLKTIYSFSKAVDLDGLQNILRQAATAIGGELFEVDALKFLPESLLGGIIHDLYVPHNLPSQNLQYNFSWIDADVLGLAYEKYLATVLAPVPQSDLVQLALFEQPVREVERKSVRKASGVYYTPTQLVRFLVESCFNNLADEISPNNIPAVADFACGSGSFLVYAASSLIARLRRHDSTKNWARELVNSKKLIGIEIDKRAVTMARLALWLRFAEEPQPLPLPKLEEIIVQGDSLGEDIWKYVPHNYDVILGNPPFLATGRTPRRDDLSIRFKSAKGKYDYSYLFIELGINHLSEHGILGMVVPNRLFRNQDANSIREIISTQTNIESVVDFGSNEVFEGISAYIGMLIAKKRGTSESNSLRVIKVRDLTPSFLSALLLQANIRGSEVDNKTLQAYDSSPHPRGQSQWLLLTSEDKKRRMSLENESVFLEEVALIKQGIRTGANDIFVVEVESGDDESLVKVVNGIGEYGLIERSLLQPVVFGSEIKEYGNPEPSRYLIYPYKNNALVLETEMREQYPHSFAYLSRYEDALSSRASLRGRSWYELAWSRSVDWLQKPKLLIRDLAIETSFAIDNTGSLFLIGGTAVIPYDPELLYPFLAYLNSGLVNKYISQTTPSFKGGFQKFEPAHLQRIPIPNKILEDEAFSSKLGDLAFSITDAVSMENEGMVDGLEKEIDEMLIDNLSI